MTEQGPANDESLQGKVAIVTGAGSPTGIGWATARALALAGANVVVTDLTLDPPDRLDVPKTGRADGAARAGGLLSLVTELEGLGSLAMAAAVDVCDRSQIDTCVAAVMARFGCIDVLVNNAGTTAGAAPFLEITAEEWDLSYGVNLRGTADFCQAVLPSMIDQSSGSIVNVASTAGLGSEAGFGAYNATKHAVVGLTKTIAAEFGEFGVRCNAVCPGYVMTAMHRGANERLAAEAGVPVEVMREQRYRGVALRRAAAPAEIGRTIAHLAGPAASYITGAAIPVSGGTPVGL